MTATISTVLVPPNPDHTSGFDADAYQFTQDLVTWTDDANALAVAVGADAATTTTKAAEGATSAAAAAASATAAAGSAATSTTKASDASAAAAAAAGSASASAASASAAVAAVAYIYPNPYSVAPTARPDGSARVAGDIYFNSTSNLNFRWNGATWVSSDINTANLAAPGGLALVGGTWFGGVVAAVSALATSIGSSLIGFIAAGAGAVARAIQDKLRESLSVEDYGAVGDWNGTTGTDNYTAFATAIAAAIAQKRRLRAEGRYYIDFGTGRDRLSVAGDLVLEGASKNASEIKFGPANVAKAIRGFDVASGANFTIRDLKLTSPSLAVFPLFDNLLEWNPVWFSPDSSTLTVERCYFGDQWHGFQVSGPGGTNPRFILKDSYFQGYNGAFNLAASGAVNGRIDATGSTFQGHQGEGSDWATRGHALYPHPHIGLAIENCRFLGGGRSLVNHFSAAGVLYTATPPEVIVFNRCYFGPCIAAGLFTTNVNSVTTLNDCIFDDCGGVQARGNVVMNNCEAKNGGSLGTAYNSDGVENFFTRMEFNNCRGSAQMSTKQGVAVPLFTPKDIDVASTGTRALFVINGGLYKTAGASVIDSSSPKNIAITGARFEWVSGTAYAAYSRVANIRLKNCEFSGAFPSGSALRTTSTGTVELVGNDFDISVSTGSVVEYNGPANSVFGENNKITGVSTFRSGNAQNLRLRKGRDPATKSSAATLTLSQNYDFYRVSGSTTITRIRLGAQDDYAKSFSDRITLVVDAAASWSLSNSVNIVPISGAARTPDEVLELVYDPSVDKWYEV